MKAFILFTNVMGGATFEAIEKVCKDAVKVTPILGATLNALYRAGGSQAVVAEYFLACGGYYAMNQIVKGIESSVETLGGDHPRKVTLFAQTIYEPHAEVLSPVTDKDRV